MERPIIFSAEMVRAILDGRKTQTRRVVKPQPEHFHYTKDAQYPCKPDGEQVSCPYGQVGDRLWVRETFCLGDGMNPSGDATKPTYKADWPDVEHSRWKPSIHMPRWASRITLEITEVRVERLQEIREKSAVREGIKPPEHAFRMISGGDIEVNESPQELFAELWDFLNAKRGYGWDTNPWVWVVSFAKLT